MLHAILYKNKNAKEPFTILEPFFLVFLVYLNCFQKERGDAVSATTPKAVDPLSSDRGRRPLVGEPFDCAPLAHHHHAVGRK